jgi:hypothetical protein
MSGFDPRELQKQLQKFREQTKKFGGGGGGKGGLGLLAITGLAVFGFGIYSSVYRGKKKKKNKKKKWKEVSGQSNLIVLLELEKKFMEKELIS